MHARSLLRVIREDLGEKMVFVAGPRQVGKTTLARALLHEEGGAYLSWDDRRQRRALLAGEWPPPPAVVVLDELHKYRHWKRWLKGEYDTRGKDYRFLVTGSARLDVYRRGGDSLQGRYHLHRLHPFTLRELAGKAPVATPFEPLPISGDHVPTRDALALLLERSGFPEPLFAATARAHRRWQTQRLDRFFREDVRDLEVIRDLSSIEILADLLPERVGSPLSLNALRSTLEVSHRAVSHWVDVLERLYFVFRLPSFGARRIRAVRKEQKAYLWDWTSILDPGPRFENLVASHLLKLCHWLRDVDGHAADLFYLRDTDKREVDFLVAIGKKPWFSVEAKLSDETPSPHLRYFAERARIPFSYQVVRDGTRDFLKDGVRVVPATRFLGAVA